MSEEGARISPDQRRFAAVLEAGMRCGLVLLVLGLVAYVAGWVAPAVPLESLPQYWGMSVAEYHRATGAPDGWGWLAHFGAGETLPMVGIAVLCSAALLAIIVLLISCVRRRDWPYVAIASLEIAVLLLAASGVLTAH